MKHKAIENMIRTQYNLADDTCVNVKFLYSVENKYTFEVEDIQRHNGDDESIRITLVEVKIQSMINILE